jgi:VWFA-related protein
MAIAPLAYTQEQRKPPEDEPIKISTELTVIDAQVLSRKTGRAVGGLSREDFILYEDGVKQYVTHFSQDKLPLSIVLLLDVSGSVQPVINQVRDEGINALKLLKPEDEVAVMAFGLWGKVVQDFTKDREAVIQSIALIDVMGHWIKEGTYIDEAVYQAASHLGKAANPDSRRAIIIITDNISNQKPDEGHSQGEAMEQLLEAGAVFSSLVVADFKAEAAMQKKSGFILHDSVTPYARETGGLNLQTNKTDVTARLADIIERLRSRYSFGYTSTNQNRDGKFRKVKLVLSPGVERREGKTAILARKGYFAPRSDDQKTAPAKKQSRP